MIVDEPSARSDANDLAGKISCFGKEESYYGHCVAVIFEAKKIHGTVLSQTRRMECYGESCEKHHNVSCGYLDINLY